MEIAGVKRTKKKGATVNHDRALASIQASVLILGAKAESLYCISVMP
jgi:hypothetical protein